MAPLFLTSQTILGPSDMIGPNINRHSVIITKWLVAYDKNISNLKKTLFLKQEEGRKYSLFEFVSNAVL